jgi:predicted transcriptional regulator
VLAVVRARGPVDAGSLAAEIGRSPGSVRRCLRLLESAALVIGEAGDGRARVWRAAE